MFEVGDIIVGLPQASEEYLYTREGVRCVVVGVTDGTYVRVALVDDNNGCDNPSCWWTVDSRYFELEKAHIYYNEKENKISYKRINKDYKEII